MHVFRYDATFEGLLSAVFDAFTRKEFPARLLGPGMVPPLCTTLIHEVQTEEEKADRVFKGLKRRLSTYGHEELMRAWLADQEERDNLLFRYTCKVFQSTRPIDMDYGDATVLAVHRLARLVYGEAHRIMGFARFQKTIQGIYFAAIAPDNNVLPLVLAHFADRMGNTPWILYDVKRHYGILREHGIYRDITLDGTTLQEGGKLKRELLDTQELLFQELWQGYYEAITIKERANLPLQARCMPRRYWPYLTETQKKHSPAEAGVALPT